MSVGSWLPNGPLSLEIAAWGLSVAWILKTVDAIRGLPTVADLGVLERDVWPRGTPSLTVVVPARNEAANLPAALDALLETDYPLLRIIAVDDRSEDETGALLDRYWGENALARPHLLDVLHIRELPHGWLGKTHALEVALRQCSSDYVLFTDADVLFSPSVLRRALAYAEAERADHLVVFPTPLIAGHGEGIVLGCFQVLGLWAFRPWRVADPRFRRDAMGVGAFNLVRREALLSLGGLEPQRLVVLEDVTIGRRFRAAGYRQRVAFAPGLVLVHWARGASGLVQVMTKNLYSGTNFQPLLVLLALAGIAVLFLAPLAGLFWWRTTLPCLMTLCCIGACYRLMGQVSAIRARYGWLFPAGVLVFCWALLRSMVSAWVNRGVVWRGTHYPLRMLREHNSPFRWELAARREKRRPAG